MRLALFPDVDSPYHKRMLDGFKGGFRVADETVEVVVYHQPLSNLDRAIDWNDARFDAVLQINGARPADLPNDTRHICWMQDVFPATEPALLATVKKTDI